MSTRSLPVADAPLLRPAARRARVLRWALTAALAAVVGAAVALSPRGGDRPAAAPALGGETTEIVLDVSGSVSDDSYRVIGRALAGLTRGRGPVGLILFSDSAEEALPPGSPPDELRPFAQIFTVRGPSASDPMTATPIRPAANPWYPSFSGGTRISVGLATAAQALRRDGVHGRIVLLSDLGDAPDDRSQLRRELLALADEGIDLRAIALANALEADRAWFTRLEGRKALVTTLPGPRVAPGRAAGNASLPVALLVLAGLLAAALAANELAGRSLRWGTAA